MRQINSQLTRDKVVAELRREILYGNLKSNQELYQDKIAEELGVSRMPVREALQILHNEGLVTVRPNKVTTVNEISEKFLKDHFEIRVLLEQEAIRRVCRNSIDCAPLWDYYEKAAEAISCHDYKMFNDYNQKIHHTIWVSAGNIQLEKILSQLWNTMMGDDNFAQKYALESNEDHRLLIKAIESHDEIRGSEIMALHVQRNYERILKRFSTT